jgi:protein-L-isoaspartate(D-aspartate) O-methyltransferase
MLGVLAMCAGWFGMPEKPTEQPSDTMAEWQSHARMRMVTQQIAARGVQDSAVLDAMRTVPRHLFVPEKYRAEAYEDHPLPIGDDQTISQPFIVGSMTEALMLSPGDTVLEIGTGSGYQAAVLAEIVAEVYTIEIVPVLGERAESTLSALDYDNVHVKVGDGYRGWPEHAPFDAIIVTAAPDHVPQPLIDQLAVGGRMVLPIGDLNQSLIVMTKTPEGIVREERYGVRFVPMTGEAQEKP